MTEAVLNRRKSQLFLNNIAPVKDTYDELVKKKLKRGKFPATKTGIIKIAGMLLLLFAVAFFIVHPYCDNAPSWYTYLLPISCSLTIICQLTFFIIFSIGYTVKKPGFWIYSDIGIMLILSITSVICSVLTFTTCQGSSGVKIGPSCGMAGSVILIISCGAIFLLFRYVEDKEVSNLNKKSQQKTSTDDSNPRKSVYA